MRQRLRTRTSNLAIVGRVVCGFFALALVWYGLMAVLLAFKVSPDTVNTISGYRTIFDELSALTPDDTSGAAARGVVAGAGLIAFLVFGWLALKELPRPYLARSDHELEDTGRGQTTVQARAFERAAEIAAREHPHVASATGRFGTDEIDVNVAVRRARGVPDTLRDVERRVRDALREQGLPVVPINVNLTGYDRKTRRELN